MGIGEILWAAGVASIVVIILAQLPLSPAMGRQPAATAATIATLEARYDEIQRNNSDLWSDYQDKLIEYTNAYNLWTSRETGYQNRIVLLESEVKQLRVRIRELESLAQIYNDGDADSLIVIGIWPDETLDVQAERDALYNAGFDYRRVSGEKATRSGVIRELNRANGGRMIVEIGAHGTQAGTELADGIAEPGWWRRVLSGRNIALVVFLSCNSDTIGDALVADGIAPVISIRDEIEDGDAGIFARELYRNLAEDFDIKRAAEKARDHVSREAWEMVRIRYA